MFQIPVLLLVILTCICHIVSSSSSSSSSNFHVIGVDAGTESLRLGIYRLNDNDNVGKPIVSVSFPYATVYPLPGHAEQDPNDWIDCLNKACNKALADGDIDPTTVKSICIDTTACSVIFLDKNHNLLRNCLLWMDTRSYNQCDKIMKGAAGDAALLVNNNGKGPLSAEWMIPKCLWVKENESELWEKCSIVFEKQDYFNYKLTDKITCSSCNVAARWHWNAQKAYDYINNDSSSHKNDNDNDDDDGRPISLLRKIGLLDLLTKWPSVRALKIMGEEVGKLTAKAAADMGLAEGTAVIQGGPDAYVAMLGLSLTKPGQLGLITGSSHLHLAVTASSTGSYKEGLWGCYDGSPLIGLSFGEGGQSSTGSVLNWYRKLVSPDPANPIAMRELDEECASVPIGSNGLLCIEKFQGSRTPITDAKARGAFIGLSLAHKRAHMWRSILEAICYGTRGCIDALKAASLGADEVHIGGGATRSPLFLQMHADVTGLKIIVGEEDNSALLGSAILAAVGSGYFNCLYDGNSINMVVDVSSNSNSNSNSNSISTTIRENIDRAVKVFVKTKETIHPNMDNHQKYNKCYRLYGLAMQVLASTMHALVDGTDSNDDSISYDGVTLIGKPLYLKDKREVVIEPSLLSADFSSIGDDTYACISEGCRWVHIDICDGVVTPGSLTVGPALVTSLHKKYPLLMMDVHLVADPKNIMLLIQQLQSAAANVRIIIQYESHMYDTITVARQIRKLGMKVGICLAPSTSITVLDSLLDTQYVNDSSGESTYLFDMIDILAVNAGFASQQFDEKVLSKVSYLYDRYRHILSHIAVDGGINDVTAAMCAKNGCNMIVSGSYLLSDISSLYKELVAVVVSNAR